MRIFRVIPLTMLAAGLFIGVKFGDVARSSTALSDAMAEQEGSAPAPAASTDLPKINPPKIDASDAKTPEKPAAKPDAKSEGGEGGEGKAKPKENPAVSNVPGDITERHFSAVEFDLLQNLAKRRDDLDRWERNIQIKEAALDATQKRIDAKIQQIEAMKQLVSDLLAQYNEKEDAKIHSLVKIYENMKPKEAARIFDEVEMPILLIVIDKMSEKKAAPILAQMAPEKAKEVTVELAEQRHLSSSRIGAVNAAGAAALGDTMPAAGPAATPVKTASP